VEANQRRGLPGELLLHAAVEAEHTIGLEPAPELNEERIDEVDVVVGGHRQGIQHRPIVFHRQGAQHLAGAHLLGARESTPPSLHGAFASA